jgi:chemotaxis response regulator CheB
MQPQFDVVAIGASAGGIEALHAVVAALPVLP